MEGISHRRQLVLIPFSRPEPQAALIRSLKRVGYAVQIFSPIGLRGGMSDGRSEAAVFLVGEAVNRDSVLSALDEAGDLPSLVMFDIVERGWDPAILDTCCDFARWPCGEVELGFRLGRLCGIGEGEGEAESWILEPTLADALAELNLIGRSPSFLAALGHLSRLVQCDAPVVITGETGTGKELVARAIHYLGPRADGPFVPVNCGALPDHLVENELFGHERGAYTDAKVFSAGAIGEATGGTLFLDEVDVLSTKAQAALLRFLQAREYRPLGGRRNLRADVRIVAASNADLRSLTKCRELRVDLYYRLNVLSIALPPLRERKEDIELLAQHFTTLFCRQYGIQRKTLDKLSLSRLRVYPWPGNVRELENLIHREILMTPGRVLQLAPETGSESRAPATRGDHTVFSEKSFAQEKAIAIANFEQDYLTRLMAQAEGNVTRAARIAGKERRSLGKLLKKYAISTGRVS